MSNYWVNEILKKYPPYCKDAGYYLKIFLRKYINKNSNLLDIGCGFKSYGSEYYKKANLKIGIDPDCESLKRNKLFDKKYCCFLKTFVRKKNIEFDVVVTQWVMEHLKKPEKEIKYINKVLKKGGYYIFMTTNINAPIIRISSYLPTKFKKLVKKKVLNVNENEVFKTYYYLNTPRKIDLLFLKNGFKKVEIKYSDGITYFAFSKISLYFRIFINKIFGSWKILNPFRNQIIGVYKKIK